MQLESSELLGCHAFIPKGASEACQVQGIMAVLVENHKAIAAVQHPAITVSTRGVKLQIKH